METEATIGESRAPLPDPEVGAEGVAAAFEEFDPAVISQADELFSNRALVIPSHTTFMSPFQKESLRYVWDELKSREGAFRRFFIRLFRRFPSEQECFERMHGFDDHQIAKVVKSLEKIIDATVNDNRGKADEELEGLGTHHREYDVKKDNFQRFSVVFLEFMAEEMKEDINDFDMEAWTIALRILVNVMGLYL